MAGKAGARHVAPKIRGAFLAALENGKLHEYMKKSLEEDFLGTLNAVSKFVPKELLIDVDENLNVNFRIADEPSAEQFDRDFAVGAPERPTDRAH